MNPTNDGRWHLVFGDPTLLGWLTLAAYLLAGLTCWRAHRSCRFGARMLLNASPAEARHQERLAHWWVGLGALMILLGLNKQLDLQTLLTEVGKDMALAQGWYAGRKQVKLAFVLLLGLALGALGLVIAYAMRRLWRRVMPSLLGVVLILGFAEVRAAVFYALSVAPASDLMTDPWFLEVAGISLVLWDAHRASVPFGRATA